MWMGGEDSHELNKRWEAVHYISITCKLWKLKMELRWIPKVLVSFLIGNLELQKLERNWVSWVSDKSFFKSQECFHFHPQSKHRLMIFLPAHILCYLGLAHCFLPGPCWWFFVLWAVVDQELLLCLCCSSNVLCPLMETYKYELTYRTTFALCHPPSLKEPFTIMEATPLPRL